MSTAELAPTVDDVPYVLSVALLAFSIAFYLMQSHRLVGWLLSKLLARFVLDTNIQLSIRSAMFAPLSGRILLQDIRYFSRNSSLLIADGYVTINWWGRLCYLRDTRPKIKVHLNGFRWTLYNNISKYEDIEAMLKARSGGDSFFQGLQEDESTVRTRSSDWQPNGKKVTGPGFYQRAMNFFGGVKFDVREGTMAFGSPSHKTPFFFNVAFKSMRGKHVLDEQCCRDDLYRVVFDSDFTDVCIKLVKYKQDETANSPTSPPHPTALSDDQTRETNDDLTDAGASDTNTETQGDKGVVKRIAKATKSLAAGMKFAFYGDAPGLRAETDFAHPKPEQLTQEFGTIIHPSEAAALRLFIYYDIPNVEETSREKLSHKVDDLPKLGMHVDILSGKVNYGPFVNFMRTKVQALFLPWDFRTWGLYKPRDGDWREHAAYEQVITFACDCDVVIPWRQKKEGLDPPRGMEYSGRNHTMVVKVGKGTRYVYKYPYLQTVKGEGVLTETYFEVKNCEMVTSLTNQVLFKAKTFTFNMDYQYAPGFVFNELHHVDYILNVKQGELWYVADISTYMMDLIADWGYPWVMYLAESFKEGWSGSREHIVKEYMPYKQRIELFLDGFDVHLNANDGNVIERHSSKKDNTIVTCRMGEATVVYCTPNDVFTVAQENEFDSTFDVKVAPIEFLLSLPEKHECFASTKGTPKYIPECFATIARIHLHGTSRAMWPDTNEAHGRPNWVPKREVPQSWSSDFPRKPKVDATHEITDLSTINLEVDRVTAALQGWHLKHLGCLASNYSGANASFVSAKDFARFSSAEHSGGRNVRSEFATYLSTQPWKTSEVHLAVTVSSCHVYFPLSHNSVTVFEAQAQQSSEASVAIYSDLAAPAVGSIPKEAMVTVLGTSGDWARVSYNGHAGWANANKLLSTKRRHNNGFAYTAKTPAFWQDEGAGDFVVVSFHDTDVGMYSSPTCSDLSCTLSPITIQCPVAADTRSQGPEYFVGVEGITYSASSLFGPAPFSQCFTNRQRLHVGTVTGHLLISQVALVEEIGETLAAHMACKDLGLEQVIKENLMPLQQTAWGQSSVRGDYRRKLSREDLMGLCASEEIVNPWHCENAIADFKVWLDNKEAVERDAQDKAYITQQVSLASFAMNLKLETGYCTAALPRGLSLGGSTLHDGNSTMRGTVMVPSFNVRLLNCKAGGLLREMEGDHLEVGSVAGALSVRYTETKKLNTDTADGQEAQRMFFQKFDLSNYGLKGIIDIESHQWQPASPRASPKMKAASHPSHLGIPKRARRHSNALPPSRSVKNPLLALNVNDIEDAGHSLEVSPSTQGQRPEGSVATADVEPTKPECDMSCMGVIDEELIDLHTAALSVATPVESPVTNASTFSEMGTPPSHPSPSHLFSSMLGTATSLPMETCVSEISDDNSSSSDSPAKYLDRSFGKRSSLGSGYWSGSLPSLRSSQGPKITRGMSLPVRRRSLDTYRPPRLAETKYGGLPWEDTGSANDIGTDEPFYHAHDKEGMSEGADMNEYAGCLQSAKLHVFRTVPKDTALLYGKGHMYSNPMYAYAPHPKVTFENRGKTTIDNTLFRQHEHRGRDSFKKQLLTPSQVVDTTENQRENTSTYHTHVSFLEPLHVLVTRQAACLVMQGAALHSLWKEDVKSRNNVKTAMGDPLAFAKSKEGKVSFKTENVVSVQLNELVTICVLGVSSVPHTLRSVVQDINFTWSVRSSGMCSLTSGKNPADTISLRVGAVGCAFQSVTSKSRSIEIPDVPIKLCEVLIVPEHRLLGILCFLPSHTNTSCLLIRGKCEQQPSSPDYVRKYTVNMTNVSLNMVKDALALRGVSSQITFLNVAWDEMHDSEAYETLEASVASAEDFSPPDPVSASVTSFVMVDHDAIGDDTNRPPTLQRLRIAARRMLFGATETVIGALKRRSRKEEDLDSFNMLPPADEAASNSGVLIDPEEVVMEDDQCLLPDDEFLSTFHPTAPDEEHRDKEKEVDKNKPTGKPATQNGFAAWLKTCLVLHVSVHVDQCSVSLAATTMLNLTQEPEANSPSIFRVRDLDVRLLCNERDAKNDALARIGFDHVVPVPLTVLVQARSISSEVNASLVGFFEKSEPSNLASPADTLDPDTPAEEPTRYFPWIYASLVIKSIDLKVVHTAHNFMSIFLKNVTALATNRPRATSLPTGRQNMSASPEFQKHRRTFHDLSEVGTANSSKPPGHRPRLSDEQMSSTPANAHSEPMQSPRSRAGSITRKRSHNVEPAKWTVSVSVSKKQREGVTLSYYCRPIRTNGELFEEVKQIFGVTLKTAQLTAIVPKWEESATLVAHVSVDGVKAAFTSYEWLHTEHCLKEWQKLFLRWGISSSRPVEVMSPMQSPSPVGVIEKESVFARPMLSLTTDVSRVEFDMPLTSDISFMYHMKRVVLSAIEVGNHHVVRVHVYPSFIKAADKEALFPGVRVTYCTGQRPSLDCYIDRVEVNITNDILNAWIHVYTVIAPEIFKWVEAKVVDEVEPRIDMATAPDSPMSTTIMWAGIRVTFIGGDTEMTISSGMGLLRHKVEEREIEDGSFLGGRCTTTPYELRIDTDPGLERAATAPTVCTPVQTYQTRWYVRLPKFNIGLHDLDKSPVVVMPSLDGTFDKRRMSVKVPRLEQDDQGEQGLPDRPHFGYRWASAQLSFYAGNCDVESLAQQDVRKARAHHTHRKSHSGGLETKSDLLHRSSLASLPALVVEPPAPSTPVKEKKTSDKVDVLVNNTMLMFRAGAPEQMQDFLDTYTNSLYEFQDRVERDRKLVLEGEALRRLRKEGRKWIKRTAETVEKARDATTKITSTIGSVIIRSASLTIPFGDKTYWSCKSIAVQGPEVLLESINEETFTRAFEEPFCIDKIWKTVATRPLPSQALQIHLGEASVATLVEQDDAPEDGSVEQPKKLVMLCKARDIHTYFSDGQPLPALWVRERGGRIDPKAGWHRQFGPNFSYIVGGKGVFLPASRELTSKELRSRCSIKDITVRARAKVWSDSISPLMVSYDVSGPEVRIAPNIVSCITDLADDFVAPPVVAAATSSFKENVSPPRGQPSLSASIVSEPVKHELSLDMDIVGKIESGTISVHSDEPLPAAFRGKDEKQDGPNTTIFTVPIPSIELRATVKIPSLVDEATGVTQTITASVLASMPPTHDKIVIHPTAVYFTNELALWRRSWPGRKAQWRDTIESHIDGLQEMLRDGLMSAQVGSVKVTGTPYTVSTAADPHDPDLFTVYMNNLRLLDLLVPVPMSLVDYSGCVEGCTAEHVGPCAKCGDAWGAHINHRCKRGGRGVWLYSQVSNPPARPISPKVLRLQANLVMQRGSLVCKQIVVRTVCDASKSAVLRVDVMASVEELEKQCKELLQISPCWRLDVRDSERVRVLLRYDDVIDGETYLVELVGAQMFLSLRIRPFTVVATTAPISECAAVVETGTTELTLIKTPKGKGANVSILLSLQPLLSTGSSLRVLIKDRHHECIAMSVTGVTAMFSPSFTKRVLLHVSKSSGGLGDAPAVRFTTRVGHLRSFFIVYKLWKKKSDDAMAELMKHTTADREGGVDYCSIAKGECASQDAPSVLSSSCVVTKINHVLVGRVDSIVFDVDNFRLSHSDTSNDKFQLTVENTYLMAAERFAKVKDGCVAPTPTKKSPQQPPSTPPVSEISFRTTSTLRPRVRAARSTVKSSMDIRSLEIGIGSLTLEAAGRIASQPSATKTTDYLIIKSKQLLNAHKLPTDDEHASAPLRCIAITLPPLEVELREMFKPLFRLRIHRKNPMKPACYLVVKDHFKPQCTASSSNPLQGYQVDVSLVAENLDLELRPLIFPKMAQVKAEMLRTKTLQELEAEKALKGAREKKKGVAINHHLGTHGFASQRQDQTQTPRQGIAQPDFTGEIVPRGVVSISIGEFVVTLGHANQPSTVTLRTQKFACQMAQNLQRVDQKHLWDRLSTTPFVDAVSSGQVLPSGTIGRVDRIIKDLTITSWKVSKMVGEADAMLIRGDRDSFFSMHTNQYLGGGNIEYSFKSKFQQAWGVGKSQEFIALREWFDGFLKEAQFSQTETAQDTRSYTAVENGFAFSPTLQVVGESTLPISALLAPLGVDESMIPAALHTYFGDSLETVIESTYRTFAPLHILRTNQSLVSDFTASYDVLNNAVRSEKMDAQSGGEALSN